MELQFSYSNRPLTTVENLLTNWDTENPHHDNSFGPNRSDQYIITSKRKSGQKLLSPKMSVIERFHSMRQTQVEAICMSTAQMCTNSSRQSQPTLYKNYDISHSLLMQGHQHYS